MRGYTAASGERTLDPAMDALSYTVVPVVEELAKIAPLLIAAISVKVRRQLGLSDYVVLGAGAGAGFGLLEVLLARVTDAQKAVAFPGGGWMIPGGISLDLTYVPDFSDVLTTWLPASIGTVSIGALNPQLDASLHLVWGALAGLGAGLLLRGPGATRRLAGLIPLGLAVGHHALFNYSGYAARRDGDPPGWATDVLARLGDVLGWLPLVALAVAMTLDYRQVRRGRRALPYILLTAEREGRTGTMALASFAACCLPWTATIAVRFARARRALFYTAPHESDALHQTVAEVAQRINEVNRDEAWDAKRVRAHLRADPATRTVRHRHWLYLITLLLAAPAVLALGVGSYPQTTDLQNWFTSGTGYTLLLACAVAGLVWLILQMVLMLRTRRAISDLPQGEPLTLLRLRLYGTAGALVVSALLLALRLKGYEADDRVVDPVVAATLFAALMEALMWAGIALALASLFLFPPAGGALAFVTVGGAMRIGTFALSMEGRALLGSSAVALAGAAGGGDAAGRSGQAPSSGEGGKPRSDRVGARREEKVAELTNGRVTATEPGKRVMVVKQPNCPRHGRRRHRRGRFLRRRGGSRQGEGSGEARAEAEHLEVCGPAAGRGCAGILREGDSGCRCESGEENTRGRQCTYIRLRVVRGERRILLLVPEGVGHLASPAPDRRSRPPGAADDQPWPRSHRQPHQWTRFVGRAGTDHHAGTGSCRRPGPWRDLQPPAVDRFGHRRLRAISSSALRRCRHRVRTGRARRAARPGSGFPLPRRAQLLAGE